MTVGATTLIDEAWGVKMADVEDIWIPLGELAAGASMTVSQSYHLDPLTPNQYQGDTVTGSPDFSFEIIYA